MKKIYYCSALSFACSLLSLNRSYAQVDIGTKLGAVSTSISNSGTFAEKTRYSYQAGLYLSFEAPVLIAVQTEFLYNRTRLQTNNLIDGLNPGMKKMGYWSLPLMVQIKPISFIRLGAGPQWNFHTNPEKYKLDNGENAFKSYLSFVGNVQLKVSNTTQLYFRYNRGLQRFENLNDRRQGKINRIEFGIQESLIRK